MTYRLGIDLGGTSAKVAVIDSRFRLIEIASVPTSGFPTPKDAVALIAKASKQMNYVKKVSRIGIGVAGDIDFDRGVVRISPNLGWRQVPLRSLLAKHFKHPILVDNDANAAAWGVYRCQTPGRIQNMAVVTLGTGVGGGIIANGKLYRGATGSAGEIGHMIIDEKGPRCNCGNFGCLETFAGGPHIVAYVKEALRKGKKSSLSQLLQRNPAQLTPRAVAMAAEKGDAFARSVWDRVGHALGVAFGNFIYLFNPERIVLTGGVAQAGRLITKPLWKTLNKRTFKTPLKAVQIKVAPGSSHIGVIGAALLDP